ncbi:hypothetical protein [uncultured Porphyromonas sp.]|uniref:hypothetical protein n=1 Tax=uncultured Porphyromonas sp. TaxID=159274 RepID=UPI00259AB9A2|nr:hypothetical protein [uncultured Porphyromonas sp.]
MEIANYTWKWENEGACGGQMLGPDKYIHLYWVDENGKEEMMKRVDYIYTNNSQKVDFGDSIKNKQNTNEFNDCGIGRWREYKVGYGPSESRVIPDANGFNFY